MARYMKNAGKGCCTECRPSVCDPCGTAHVRFWNLQPAAARTAKIEGSGLTFDNIPAGDYSTQHGEMAAGRYDVTVTIGGQVFTLPADFQTDGYYTIFIREQFADGPLSVTILDDNWEIGDPVILRVHQLFWSEPSGTATATFKTNNLDGGPDGDPPATFNTVGSFGALSYGGDLTMTGLPATGAPYDPYGQGDDLDAVQAEFTLTKPSGSTNTWSTSFNSHVQRLFDVLVIGDGAGRFRPRIFGAGPVYGDE